MRRLNIGDRWEYYGYKNETYRRTSFLDGGYMWKRRMHVGGYCGDTFEEDDILERERFNLFREEKLKRILK